LVGQAAEHQQVHDNVSEDGVIELASAIRAGIARTEEQVYKVKGRNAAEAKLQLSAYLVL
jgi:hypothetical protein